MLILKLLAWRMDTVFWFTCRLAVTRADGLWNSLESQHFLTAFMEVGLWEVGGFFWGGRQALQHGDTKSEMLGTGQILRVEKSEGPDSSLLPLRYHTSPLQVRSNRIKICSNLLKSLQVRQGETTRPKRDPELWARTESSFPWGNENLCFAGLKSKPRGRCQSKGVLLAAPPLSHQPLVLLDQRKWLKTKTLNQPQTHRDVKYGTGNKVNNIVLTTYGARWATYWGDRFVR